MPAAFTAAHVGVDIERTTMLGGQYVGAASIGVCNKKPAGGDSVVLLSAQCWNSDASRKLVNQGHHVFQKMQHLREKSEDPLNLDVRACINICHEYRSALQSCAIEITSDPQYEDSMHISQESLECRELLEMDKLWHLVEIFFVRKKHLLKTGGLVLLDVLDWVRHHFQNATLDAAAVLKSHGAPERHGQYWDSIFTLLLQGDVSNAMDMITRHSQYQQMPQNSFERMRYLISKMPMLSPEASSTAFYRVWNQWQQECRTWLDTQFTDVPELHDICRLLSGDLDILGAKKHLARSWPRLMVARLLYTNPLAKFFDLQEELEWAISELPCQTEVENLLKLTIQQDVLQLIRDSCNCFGFNLWFPCHLLDVLIGTGSCPAAILHAEFGDDIRTSRITEFASSLLAQPSLCSLAPAYFASCGPFGMACLEAHLERMPVDCERKALKLLQVCHDNNLGQLACTICRVLGRQAVDNEQLGAALSWFGRAKDAASVTQLADRILIKHQLAKTSGSTTNFLEMLDILQPMAHLSDRLAFLSAYGELLKLVHGNDYVSAAERLVVLLTTPQMVPKWYAIDLLLDALPLLEHDEVVVSAPHTKVMLSKLEDLVVSHQAHGYLFGPCGVGHGTTTPGTPEDDAVKLHRERRVDEIDTLRLALARNLSRAIFSVPQF
eukprot:m.351658 g.351658  ORF g.351658 m.351658 type:complete len:666 (+) comp20703_c0_seq2:285-2282(+)